MRPRVCQWRGCIREAEIRVWFDPKLRPNANGRYDPLQPVLYCFRHYCRADDLFVLERAGSLTEGLIRSP